MILKGYSIGARKEVLIKTEDIKALRLDRPVVFVPGVGQVSLKRAAMEQARREFQQEPISDLAALLATAQVEGELPMEESEEETISPEPMIGPLTREEAMAATGLDNAELAELASEGRLDMHRDESGTWQIFLPEDLKR